MDIKKFIEKNLQELPVQGFMVLDENGLYLNSRDGIMWVDDPRHAWILSEKNQAEEVAKDNWKVITVSISRLK